MIVKIALSLAVILCVVSGNLMLKIGSGKSGIHHIWPFSLVNLYTIIGISSFAVGVFFYISLLKNMPLNIAQTIFSMQFVIVILASSIILHEPIDPIRWVGIGFIAVGLAIVAWTTSFS